MVDKIGTIGTACLRSRFRRGHFTAGDPAMHVTSQMANSPGDLVSSPAPTLLPWISQDECCFSCFLDTNPWDEVAMVLSFLLSEIDYNAPTAFGVPLGTLILFLWLMSNNNRRRDD